MIRFLKLDKNGRTSVERDIPQEAILKCPHCIIVEGHYREDNTCRCDDSRHFEMAQWGYMWNGEQWVTTPENDDDKQD